MSGPQSMLIMVTFAIAMTTGIWITIVVCIRNKTGEPVVGLFLLLIAPFPLLLFGQPRDGVDMPEALQDGDDLKVSSARRLGMFIFSMFMTLAYGSVFLMLRNYTLTPWWAAWAAVGMTFAGTMSFIVLRCSIRGGCN